MTCDVKLSNGKFFGTKVLSSRHDLANELFPPRGDFNWSVATTRGNLLSLTVNEYLSFDFIRSDAPLIRGMQEQQQRVGEAGEDAAAAAEAFEAATQGAVAGADTDNVVETAMQQSEEEEAEEEEKKAEIASTGCSIA